MEIPDDDDLRRIAEKVADTLAYSGYAFVEDGGVDELTSMLHTFLSEWGILADTC